MGIQLSSISCIIPTRDRCALLADAIESVYQQEGYDLEIIVVDDGSTDGTDALLHKHYPGVKVVHTQGVGPGLARNAGVESASGAYLMFLDSDDIWLPGHVARLAEVLSRGYRIAYGTTRNLDQIHDNEFLIPEAGKGITGNCYHELLRWCFLVPSAVAVERKAFFEAGGFFPGDMGEDWHFFLRLASRYHFGFSGSEPITVRRLHRGSLCCFVDQQKILSSVSRIKEAARKENPDTQDIDARFMVMEQFIMEQGEAWQTVQDWYTAMKREGII